VVFSNKDAVGDFVHGQGEICMIPDVFASPQAPERIFAFASFEKARYFNTANP